jgi:hypothetical protein
MLGAILEVEDMDYIYIEKLFSDMEEFYLGFNWLISDYECYKYPSTKIPFSKKYVWLTGAELGEVMRQNRLPFIWGTYSGFLPEVTLDEVLSSCLSGLPYAEGAESFWKSDFKLQHPLSEIEVIAWEATYFIIMSRNEDLIHRFREKYPLSEDLWKYNQMRGW